MSNPIINPFWIYLINLLTNLDSLCVAIIVFSGVFLVVFGIIYFLWREEDYSPNYEDEVTKDKFYQRILKRCAIIFTVWSLLFTLIPSEETMYTMFVASYVTVENLEMTGDTITDMVDYIFEKVDELGDND